MSNSWDSDQARHFVWPDLSPNGLQSLLEDNTNKQRVKAGVFSERWIRLKDLSIDEMVVQFYLLLSPYLCYISFLYLDLDVLGADALIS